MLLLLPRRLANAQGCTESANELRKAGKIRKLSFFSSFLFLRFGFCLSYATRHIWWCTSVKRMRAREHELASSYSFCHEPLTARFVRWMFKNYLGFFDFNFRDFFARVIAELKVLATYIYGPCATGGYTVTENIVSSIRGCFFDRSSGWRVSRFETVQPYVKIGTNTYNQLHHGNGYLQTCLDSKGKVDNRDIGRDVNVEMTTSTWKSRPSFLFFIFPPNKCCFLGFRTPWHLLVSGHKANCQHYRRPSTSCVQPYARLI